MRIDDLIKGLEITKRQAGNLDIYLEVNADEDCLTCGKPETHIYDGFPDRITVMNINSIPTLAIVATRDSERPISP